MFDREVQITNVGGIIGNSTSANYSMTKNGNKIKIFDTNIPQHHEIIIETAIGSVSPPEILRLVWTLDDKNGYYVENKQNGKSRQLVPEKDVEWNIFEKLTELK